MEYLLVEPQLGRYEFEVAVLGSGLCEVLESELEPCRPVGYLNILSVSIVYAELEPHEQSHCFQVLLNLLYCSAIRPSSEYVNHLQVYSLSDRVY